MNLILVNQRFKLVLSYSGLSDFVDYPVYINTNAMASHNIGGKTCQISESSNIGYFKIC